MQEVFLVMADVTHAAADSRGDPASPDGAEAAGQDQGHWDHRVALAHLQEDFRQVGG